MAKDQVCLFFGKISVTTLLIDKTFWHHLVFIMPQRLQSSSNEPDSTVLQLLRYFTKNGDCAAIADRLYFNFRSHSPTPAEHAITVWVKNFEATRSTLNQNPTGTQDKNTKAQCETFFNSVTNFFRSGDLKSKCAYHLMERIKTYPHASEAYSYSAVKFRSNNDEFMLFLSV